MSLNGFKLQLYRYFVAFYFPCYAALGHDVGLSVFHFGCPLKSMR